jgi:hypothetical protein
MGDCTIKSIIIELQTAAFYGADEAEFSLWTEYKMWCLGHNFDVVGAILAMSELSWQKGFEAGKVTAHFDDESLASLSADDAAAVYSVALHKRKHTKNRGGSN